MGIGLANGVQPPIYTCIRPSSHCNAVIVPALLSKHRSSPGTDKFTNINNAAGTHDLDKPD